MVPNGTRVRTYQMVRTRVQILHYLKNNLKYKHSGATGTLASGHCQHRRHHGILQLRFQLDSDVCSADLHHNPRKHVRTTWYHRYTCNKTSGYVYVPKWYSEYTCTYHGTRVRVPWYCLFCINRVYRWYGNTCTYVSIMVPLMVRTLVRTTGTMVRTNGTYLR